MVGLVLGQNEGDVVGLVLGKVEGLVVGVSVAQKKKSIQRVRTDKFTKKNKSKS